MLGDVLTAIVTPFKRDGSVDLDSFRALARHLVENGSDGLVVTGTTGEGLTLSTTSGSRSMPPRSRRSASRATVVAGTGTYDTRHSIHLTEQAHELGVDAFLVVTPYYCKPPQRGIVAHFEAVAAATDRPVVVYNIPEPRRDQHRARDDLAARRDRERYARSSRPTTISTEATHIVEIGLDLYAGRRRPDPAVPRARRRRRHLRAHACRRAAGEGAGPAL